MQNKTKHIKAFLAVKMAVNLNWKCPDNLVNIVVLSNIINGIIN